MHNILKPVSVSLPADLVRALRGMRINLSAEVRDLLRLLVTRQLHPGDLARGLPQAPPVPVPEPDRSLGLFISLEDPTPYPWLPKPGDVVYEYAEPGLRNLIDTIRARHELLHPPP